MGYQSVDALQLALTKDVFHYAKDAKKAAGRAMGTLVEVITFYLTKTWGYEKHTLIETRLPEYANPDIRHNVEFTFHPSTLVGTVDVAKGDLPITARKLGMKAFGKGLDVEYCGGQLLSSDGVLRNACILYQDEVRAMVAYLVSCSSTSYRVALCELLLHPFALFECKRVGVEEGMGKGPQTIEKAKQGAYVARAVSSLQKIRMADGTINGILEVEGGVLESKPYGEFLETVIGSSDAGVLRHFTLTVGVVSNHGNWFTSDDHNKELKVLAQSYDWLLFLTDSGLSEFCDSLLSKPAKKYEAIKKAFLGSYTGTVGGNRFTKVKMALEADVGLQEYFSGNLSRVESWFNVISPTGRTIADLRMAMDRLCSKDWKKILG